MKVNTTLAVMTFSLGIAAALAENPGTLDSTFNPVLGPSYASTVQTVAVQKDGKTLIGGDFTTVNGATASYMARLNSAGALDTSFVAEPGANNYVRFITELSDGKILVGGDFTTINGASWRGVARLNSNGAPDTSFNQFSGVNGSAYTLAVQADGKILVGGSFSTVNGTSRSYLARLTTSGALDTTFVPLLDGVVSAIVVRPDGKILVGGNFQHVNNLTRGYLVQLNPADGSTDSSFNSNVDSTVNTVCLQTNGQAIIGGWFNYVSGARHDYVARLNSNGSPDATFTANASGIVYTVLVQPNGKVIVGGRFSYMNGTSENNLALLNTNGLLDTGLDTGTGPDYTVRSVALQSDGKLIIGGDFSHVSMQARTFTARIWGDPPPPVAPLDELQIWNAVEIGWNSQTGATYQVQWSSEASSANWQNFGSPVNGTGSLITVFDSTRVNGKRFYRVVKTAP